MEAKEGQVNFATRGGQTIQVQERNPSSPNNVLPCFECILSSGYPIGVFLVALESLLNYLQILFLASRPHSDYIMKKTGL